MRGSEFERPYWERGLEPNAPIVLWRETGTVKLGGPFFDVEITVFLDFWPEPKVLVGMDLPAGLNGLDSDGEFVFRLPSGQRRMECLLVERERGRVVLRPKDEWVIGEATAAVESVGFGIPNFPVFGAGVMRDDETGERRRLEEIQLRAGEWLIALVPAEGAAGQYQQLKRRGGYGVTAIGRIWREDGRQFGYTEVAPLLDELRFFLSFVLGRWTGAVRPTGLDGSGAVVWERGGLPVLDPGVKQQNWFSPDHANCLGCVFPGFHGRWNDPDGMEAIRFAINWYVRAKSETAGVEGALVLSCAGLEVLAFRVFVKRKEANRSIGKYPRSLADRLRGMFEVVGLPVELPDLGEFTERYPWPSGWRDGPEALSRMRNDLMHAEKESKKSPYPSGWWLAQWYLELCLLWAFQYQGDYLDRRDLNGPPVAVPVPWASRATA